MPALAAAPSGARYHRGIGRRRHFRVMLHEQPGEQNNGQDHVHRGPRQRDQQPLPAWFGDKTARIGGFFSGLIAGHFDIAAQNRQRGKAEIGFPVLESEKPRAKAKTESFHFHVEQPGDGKVAQLMEQDHHSNQNQEPPDILQKNHIGYARTAASFGSLTPHLVSIMLRAFSRERRSTSSTSCTDLGSRRATRCKVSATVAAMAGNGIRPDRKASTAISSAAFKVAVEDPPASCAW